MKKNYYTKLNLLSAVLTLLSISVFANAADKVKGYKAQLGFVCNGSYQHHHGSKEKFTVEITVNKDGSGLMKRTAENPDLDLDRQTSFESISGLQDAYGRSIYTAEGFSLLIDRAADDSVRAVYSGALGLGAWQVQEFETIPLTTCKFL